MAPDGSSVPETSISEASHTHSTRNAPKRKHVELPPRPSCPVQAQFDKLVLLINAYRLNDQKKSNDHQEVDCLIMDNILATTAYASMLPVKSSTGAFLLLCLIHDYVRDMADELDCELEDRAGLTAERAEASSNYRRIIAMLYALRQWVYANMDGTMADGSPVRLQDLADVADWFMSNAQDPHAVVSEAILEAA